MTRRQAREQLEVARDLIEQVGIEYEDAAVSGILAKINREITDLKAPRYQEDAAGRMVRYGRGGY